MRNIELTGSVWSVKLEKTCQGKGPRVRGVGGGLFVLLVLVALFVWLTGEAWSQPITSMAKAPTGTVKFQTLTLSSSDFWKGVKTGQAVTISGDLTLPKGDDRVPAIIMSHGSGGVGECGTTWARELRSQGVATFLVDSFTGRGIKESPSEDRLSILGQVYDVYQALALLATHPRIDPVRIALMGQSRGGGLTVRAAMARSRKAQLPDGVDFCGYLALYPAIAVALGDQPFAGKPIRIFTGTWDEAVSIKVVRAFTDKARASGADIRLFEYEGAHHAFDCPDIRKPFLARGTNSSFTVEYHPRAHGKLKSDMKETLMEIFGPR